MDEKDQPNPFLPSEKLDPDKFSVEIPAEQKPAYYDRIPSGYDPMGEIYLRGRASGSLAGGRVPWWVLISGWIMFGGFTLPIIYAAIIARSFIVLLPLVFAVIPLLILWRGTVAKLAQKKARQRR